MSGHPTPKLVAVDVILVNYTMFRQVPDFFSDMLMHLKHDFIRLSGQ